MRIVVNDARNSERAKESGGRKWSSCDVGRCVACGKPFDLHAEVDRLLLTRTESGLIVAIDHPREALAKDVYPREIWIAPIGSECLRKQPALAELTFRLDGGGR